MSSVDGSAPGRADADGRRLAPLVEALVAIHSGLEFSDTLRRILVSARKLTDARYAALGVRSSANSLSDFFYEGIDEETAAKIGHLPEGKGLLGLLLNRPETIRLADLGQHPDAAGFPAHHPTMRTFLGVPIRVRGQVYGNLYLTEKRDGCEFTSDDERVIETLAIAAGVAIENATLYEHQRRHLAWLDALREMTADLLAEEADPQLSLQAIVDRACGLAAAEQALIAVPPDPELESYEETTDLRVSAVSGPRAEKALGTILPIERSTSGETFRRHEPRATPRLKIDPFSGARGRIERPALVLPLRTMGTVLGVLIVLRNDGDAQFTEEDLDYMSAYADQAALVLALVRTREERHELALVADRERIARDMHDHVIQRIFAAGLALQTTVQRAKSREVRERLAATIDDLQEVIHDIRVTIYDLREAAGSVTLRRRLYDIVDEFSESTTARIRIYVTGPTMIIDPELAEHAQAVVREALSNAVHHANSDLISVGITVDDNLVIEVTDDGIGITAETALSGGLRNLADRAAAMRGHFTITPSEEGHGTRLEWSAPLAR